MDSLYPFNRIKEQVNLLSDPLNKMNDVKYKILKFKI